jgi:hypothetical protein
VNRGTLCPKGAAAIDYIRAETRVRYPMHRKPGTDKFERVSWDFAMDRIARLMKDDRDANWIERKLPDQAGHRHRLPVRRGRLEAGRAESVPARLLTLRPRLELAIARSRAAPLSTAPPPAEWSAKTSSGIWQTGERGCAMLTPFRIAMEAVSPCARVAAALPDPLPDEPMAADS